MSDQQLSDMQLKATVDPAPPGEWGSLSSPARTVVLRHHLQTACNCAVASPDGNWIAVVGDEPSLGLLHISDSYAEGHTGSRRGPGSGKGSILKFGAKQPRRTSRSNPRHTGRSAGVLLRKWTQANLKGCMRLYECSVDTVVCRLALPCLPLPCPALPCPALPCTVAYPNSLAGLLHSSFCTS